MTETLSLPDIEALARDCLTRADVPDKVAQAVAREIAAAEAAGERIHGLEALLRDLRAIRYGHLIPDAPAKLSHPRPGFLTLDAQHGFAAAALDSAVVELGQLALTQGVAMLRLDQASPAGAMIAPVTRLARDGFIAMAFGQTGPGRFAHPASRTAIRLSEDTPHSPVMALLGLADAPLDDPLSGPVSHSAWMIAADPETVGAERFGRDLWDAASPPTPAREVVLAPGLLEQIVTA